jgi:hypothetical protein
MNTTTSLVISAEERHVNGIIASLVENAGKYGETISSILSRYAIYATKDTQPVTNTGETSSSSRKPDTGKRSSTGGTDCR